MRDMGDVGDVGDGGPEMGDRNLEDVGWGAQKRGQGRYGGHSLQVFKDNTISRHNDKAIFIIRFLNLVNAQIPGHGLQLLGFTTIQFFIGASIFQQTAAGSPGALPTGS